MSTMNDADRDRALYELPANVVVSAGAGTGKTHRLTGLYLHLVSGLTELGGPLSPDAIVATTFTREAASEMRARIEGRLRLLVDRDLVALQDDPSAEAWARELSQTCLRRSASAPARDVWRAALDRLPRGTITTFHAWAGDLVRAYPLEARVPPTFTLIEPEEADELVLGALDSVLARWVDDETLVTAPGVQASAITRRAAVQQLLVSGLDRLEEAVLRALMRTAEDGIELLHLPLADDDAGVHAARSRRGALLAALEEGLAARGRVDVDARAAMHELRAIASTAPEDGRHDAARVEKFGALVKTLHASLGRSPGADAVKRVLEGAVGTTIAERAARILDDPSACRAAIALDAAARALLAEVSARVEDEKRRTRSLDFGDVMRKARDLLLHHPDVQAEVAESVKALLVDEFQDTNALQRDLVYLVWQERDAIARRKPGERPAASTLRPRGLFLVGDRKQSIYGFRGADVAVFQQMAVELAGDEARTSLGLPASAAPATSERAGGRLITLDENRRSVAEVLRFVNRVAAVDMQGHEGLAPVQQVVFQPHAEDLKPVRSSGLPPMDECPRVVVPLITLPEKGTIDDVSRDLAASLALAAELRRLLDDPKSHHLGGEPRLRARDVAILIQTYAVLPSLELALSCHGIEYTVAARRGLYRTIEAGDLEAFVRLAIEPDDRNALLAVLRGPYVTLSDTALLGLTTDRGLTLPTDVPLNAPLRDDERARLHRLREALDFVRAHEPRLGAEKALSRALSHLGVERVLSLLPRGEQRIGDLRRLVEIAGTIPSGLVGFARHLARARASATSVASARKVDDARGAVFDRDDDVVRIMTVHASKGLEFRVVAVMQLEHQGKPGESAPILVERRGESLSIAARVERGDRGVYGEGGRRLAAQAKAAARAERQRLTYVALTRARDLLWVVAAPIAGKYLGHTAAHSIHVELGDDASIARRPIWTPTVSSPLPPSIDEASPPPRPAFGEGSFPASTTGSVVVTTALADFAGCARRFRLLHLVGLTEQPPHVPELPRLGASTVDGRGQLALFSGALSPDAPSVVEVERDLARDATHGEEDDAGGVAEGEGEAPARMPVAPPPIDPRVQGVVAHLAIERAPLESAPRDSSPARARWAHDYATTFLRGEGYDPEAEPGRVLVDRIARFLGSDYARSLGAGVEVRREHPFLVTLPSGIALRGTIDLLVVRPGATPTGAPRIEIVDYKLRAGKGGDVAKHALQLRAYAAAVSLAAPTGAEIVAGIAFLGAGDGAPLWLDEGRDLAGPGSIAPIDEVARRLLAARAANAWPGVARPRCDALGCGFRPLCHPRKAGRAP